MTEEQRHELYREAAKDNYVEPSDNEIEMDPDAEVSECADDTGAWVHVWVYVGAEDAGVSYEE